MTLFFCNVVLLIWELFAGENEKIGGDQPWVISNAVCGVIGREIGAGRWTVRSTRRAHLGIFANIWAPTRASIGCTSC